MVCGCFTYGRRFLANGVLDVAMAALGGIATYRAIAES